MSTVGDYNEAAAKDALQADFALDGGAAMCERARTAEREAIAQWLEKDAVRWRRAATRAEALGNLDAATGNLRTANVVMSLARNIRRGKHRK